MRDAVVAGARFPIVDVGDVLPTFIGPKAKPRSQCPPLTLLLEETPRRWDSTREQLPETTLVLCPPTKRALALALEWVGVEDLG